MFLFGQGVPSGLPTQQNWKHLALYYNGWFNDPLFIVHGFNQIQCACCIWNLARITRKNQATLKTLGVLANSDKFWRQLTWARDHPHSQEAKSLNAKVSRILSMVGSTIPYSPFECALTRPKLNAMRYCYGVGSNFITGAPPEFEDLLTLWPCMKPKFNDPKCVILKWDFTQSNLPDQISNETSICMRMTKQQPFLEAQNFHHKLQIVLEAIIGCKNLIGNTSKSWLLTIWLACISLYCSLQWCDRTKARWLFTLAYNVIFKCPDTSIVRKISSCFINGIVDTS